MVAGSSIPITRSPVSYSGGSSKVVDDGKGRIPFCAMAERRSRPTCRLVARGDIGLLFEWFVGAAGVTVGDEGVR
jgi:hypothetical protein